MSKFIILGQEFHITMEELEEKMINVEPRKYDRNMYFVEICGNLFPIKQPIQIATGLSAMEITMLDAYMTLEKLGYRISFHRYYGGRFSK